MTEERAKKMLKAKLECLKRETSGTDDACNQHLCEGCSLNYEQGNMGEQKEALEMAIKALAQESITWIVGKDNCQVAVKNMPSDKIQKICAIISDEEQQPCEDCVSREQALEAIDTWDKFGYTYTGCFVREPKGDYVPYVHYDDMVKCIKNLPSVKPQRPKGKWIEQNDTSKHHFGWYYCSNCGAYLMSADGANYCSCCGAEMEDSND